MDTPQPLTIQSASSAFLRTDPTGASLAAACRERIRKLNGSLKAFITVTKPEQGAQPMTPTPAGPLRGITVAVKDLFDTAGILTTAGSRFFADHVPQSDAFVVRKLKEAGALVIGKTNTHEIALGVTGNNPHYGTARNPWDPSRIPGGSSSGSAIAVATGMAVAALGTDTGGSIRIPASLCGVVGMKPTYGLCSVRGVAPLSWNLDTVGPLANCVRDAAIMLQVISGFDPEDPSSIRTPAQDYAGSLTGELSGTRVALAVGEYVSASDPEVLGAVREAASVFQSAGCTVGELNFDCARDAATANRLMTQADGAAVHRDRLREHPEMFGADVRARLETGAKTTSTEYVLARRLQADLKRRCEELFDRFDVLILPTTPAAALPIESDANWAGLLTPFTAPFNLAGLPALSLPCGFTREGLPIGLQIVSRAWADDVVLNAGHAYERRTGWHSRRPAL